MKTAIGIDVSKDTLDVCVLQGEAKAKHHKFVNNLTGFKGLERWVLEQAPSAPRHFCMESTGCYSFGIAAYLADSGHTVSVENGRPIKYFAIAAKLKVKTDRADAYCIALYCKLMEPREWTLKDPLQRELFTARNRLRQLDKSRLAELARLEDTHLPEFAKTQIIDHVQYIDTQVRDARERVKELMEQCPDARTVYQAVTGINGAGPETGLLMATLDILSFDKAQDVAAYFGLNPRLHESGKFCGQTRISKCGDASGRSTLMSAAFSAIKHNAVFGAFYANLIARGLRKKQAAAAVARKLVMAAWAIARNALLGRPVTYPGGECRNTNLRLYCAQA